MEIPLVVGKNKCVIVSSSLYTPLNRMPEILRTRLQHELHSCESGEAIMPGPKPDTSHQVSSGTDSHRPPRSSFHSHPPLCPSPCPAVNESQLYSAWA